MSRAVRVVAGLLACVLVLAGCSTLAALQDLSAEIQDAGYSNVNVNHQSTNGNDVLAIEATREQPTSSADALEIAEIAWTTYAAEFDELQVVLNGFPELALGAADLRSRFGERPADLGAESTDSGGMNVTALVVVLACAAAFAVLLVLMWRRGRRPPPGPGQPYPPQQYPPQYPQQYSQHYPQQHPPGPYQYGPPPQ